MKGRVVIVSELELGYTLVVENGSVADDVDLGNSGDGVEVRFEDLDGLGGLVSVAILISGRVEGLCIALRMDVSKRLKLAGPP